MSSSRLERGSVTADRTFEAICFRWVTPPDMWSGEFEIRERIDALCGFGAHVVVVTNLDPAIEAGQILSRCSGPGSLHVCMPRIGEVHAVTASGPSLRWRGEGGQRNGSAALRWIAAWLAGRGITGSLVLVVGDVPGASAAFDRAVVVDTDVEAPLVERILDEQLDRRCSGRVPSVDADPAWIIPLPVGALVEGAAEAIGTLGNGWAASRAVLEERLDVPGTFLVNGVFTADPVPTLVGGPNWSSVAVRGASATRRLDLRTGVLVRDSADPQLRTLKLISAHQPHALALRAEGSSCCLPVPDDDGATDGRGAQVMASDGRGGGGIVIATSDRVRAVDGHHLVDRLGAWTASAHGRPSDDAVQCLLAELESAGFDRILAEHRAAWAERWSDAAVVISGSPEDELSARFAVFHLLASVPDAGEAAVGPRGLTGPAYGGHVFWDADVFVLPALAAIRPSAARAMLEYRLRRLPAARAAAIALGGRGARFPWESASDGTEVTPPIVTLSSGEEVLVRTDEHEEHVVADVAWAADEYSRWTGDAAFLTTAGRDLVLDTARWWADRIRVGSDGRAHLDHVMGPDEYHDEVDDNAFTNVMARWNLRRAADLADELGLAGDEPSYWRRLADSLVDGFDPATGLYEQFTGYWDLEPLLAAQVAQPPFAADALLGTDRVDRSQLIKQPDVLMLHHMIPSETRPGSLERNLDVYAARTTHGSSLSPAIHAALHARAGKPDDALALFRMAARLDLDDITGTTAAGLHLATMGGVWQALAYGFLGLRPTSCALEVDPRLPRSWDALELGLRFGQARTRIRADHERLHLTCDAPVTLQLPGGAPQICPPPGATFDLDEPDAPRRAP
jgi:trehalose/maltose hydrolase-like predicted phosphorylase